MVLTILVITRAALCAYWCREALKHCPNNLESFKSPPEETNKSSTSLCFQKKLRGTLVNTRSEYKITFVCHMNLKLSNKDEANEKETNAS